MLGVSGAAGDKWGGLPEFDGAVAIAVAQDAGGARKKIAAFDLRWRDGRFCGDARTVDAALRAGANEWHIHLLAETEQSRRAAIDDMSS